MPDFYGNCTPGVLGQPGIAKLLLGPITGVQLPSFFTPPHGSIQGERRSDQRRPHQPVTNPASAYQNSSKAPRRHASPAGFKAASG
jgi:hypothetical protein